MPFHQFYFYLFYSDILDTQKIELGSHESLVLENIVKINSIQELVSTIYDKTSFYNLIRLIYNGFTLLVTGDIIHKSST